MGKTSSKRHSWLVQVVCIALMFSLFTSSFAGVASAKETRAAIAVSVTGTVMVTKAGGSNEYRAYSDMSLNQGDHIRTESGSSIVLQVVDQEDEVTIGPDTELYISSLMETGGAKKSKFKMWAGSVWFKVKKLVNADDEFEVETPTTVMGVRGSNGYIESKLGQLFAMMASGVLATETKGGGSGDESSETSVLPGQQINLFEDQSGDPSEGLTGLDVTEFVKKADPAMIEKLLETIQEIQEENEKFAADVGSGSKQVDPKTGLKLGDASTLSQFRDNLSNLVANVAKVALDENKVDKATIQALIDKANETTTGSKIDLNNVKPFDKTIGSDPDVLKAKEEALAKMKEQQLQKLEDAKKELEEKQKQNADLLKNLEDKKKELDEANKAAKDEQTKEAQDKYTNTLSAADKQKFEQDKQKADNEKKAQEDQQKTNTGGTTEPNTNTGNTGNGNTGGETDPGEGTGTVTAPTGVLHVSGNGTVSLGTASSAKVNLYFDQVSGNPTKMIFANEDGAFGAQENFAMTKSEYVLSPGSGTKTIKVKLYDALGHESSVISVQVDVIPAAPSFTTANLVTPTNNPILSLTVQAQPGSTVKAWVGAAERGKVLIGNDGTAILSIRLEEGPNDLTLSTLAGTLESTKVPFAVITLDIMAPSADLQIEGSSTITLTGTDTSAKVNLHFENVLGNPSEMSFANEDGAFSPRESFNVNKLNYELSTGAGEKTIHSKLYDQAGNVSLVDLHVTVVNPGRVYFKTNEEPDLTDLRPYYDYFNVELWMDNNFKGPNAFYAVQVELEYEDTVQLVSDYNFNNGKFSSTEGDRTSAIGEKESVNGTHTLVYVGTLFENGSTTRDNISLTNDEMLVRMQFEPIGNENGEPSQGSIRIKTIMVLNKQLQVINVIPGSAIQFAVGGPV